MRRILVSAALVAVAGIVPAAADWLYVPVVGAAGADGRALPTEIWVANGGVAKSVVRADFLGSARGEAKTFAVEPGGRMLGRLAGAGEVGLVAIDAAEMAVSAWIPDQSGTSINEVPVIGPHDTFEPGATPGLELEPAYEKLFVGAANVSDEPASCEAILFGEGFAELGRFELEVPAKSLVRQDASATIGEGRATYAQVGCNRAFYPIGVTTRSGDGGLQAAVAKGIGPNGACSKFLVLVALPNGHYLATLEPGVFHTVTKADPKGILCLQATKELKIASAVFQWDVFVGPWSKRDKSGLHNLAYYFLDRYRGGVVANANAAGPNKSFLKVMQNVSMAAGTNTNNKAAYLLEVGQTYHFVYTYDAANKKATLQTFLQGVEVRGFNLDTRPGNNQTLVVRPYTPQGLALVAEFGNYFNQHAPEMASEGWKFSNFKVEMTPK